MKRKFAALMCALTLCTGLVLPAAAAGFTDVSAQQNHFPDVAPDSWYAAAANWACEAEIIQGTDKGAFSDGVVTRQELAVILTRYDEYKGRTLAEGALNLYSDANQVAAWAKDGVAHAIGMGWLEGSNGKLSPKGSTTRAQLAVILQRMNTEAMG